MSGIIRELYEGDSPRAHHFRYGLLVFDITSILFVIVTSFFPHTQAVAIADVCFGTVMLADFICRLVLKRGRPLLQPTGWADIVTIASFLAPIAGEGFGFLRVLRILRLLYSYRLAAQLRQDSRLFRRYDDVILAGINLFVFLFVMTGLIFVTQAGVSPHIHNYVDALYFTVTTLTTTGYGDVTLEGTSGRLFSVAVMIVGVTLFLRLLQLLFRPRKIRFECRKCGLMLHDRDAIHCKHCGRILHKRHEGLDAPPLDPMAGGD